MENRSRQILTRVAILAAFAAWSCGSGETEAGNELIFASSADATILDPHDTTDSQSDQIIRMIYNGLIRFDENMNIVGDLATDWNMAEDGRTWTFNLRQGVRFHDGSPFNAEAVRRNFARVLAREQNFKRRPLFEVIENVEVVDDLTLRIVTRHPFGAFEPTMAHISAYIVNPDVAEAHGKSFGTSPETTNPAISTFGPVPTSPRVAMLTNSADGSFWLESSAS